jgi:hypothetical protein
MATKTNAKKSCGPQLSTDEPPSRTWDFDRLSTYAKRQCELIVKSETTLAPYYWRLGQALALARETLNRGQWGQFLTSLGIEKTRSSKARTIYQAYGTVDEVEGMSVEQAYEARRRNSQDAEAVAAEDKAVMPVRFCKALAKVEKSAVAAFECVSELTKSEKQELLDNLRQTIACLQGHAKRLEGEIATGQAD